MYIKIYTLCNTVLENLAIVKYGKTITYIFLDIYTMFCQKIKQFLKTTEVYLWKL